MRRDWRGTVGLLKQKGGVRTQKGMQVQGKKISQMGLVLMLKALIVEPMQTRLLPMQKVNLVTLAANVRTVKDISFLQGIS